MTILYKTRTGGEDSPSERSVDIDKRQLSDQFDAIASGRHGDPFAILGLHLVGSQQQVRTFQPQAQSVQLIGDNHQPVIEMVQIHEGLFEGELPKGMDNYRFRCVDQHDAVTEIEDCYRFPPVLRELILDPSKNSAVQQIYNHLGGHVTEYQGIKGVRFAVWAPNASRVSVVGDFNDWDGRRTPMHQHGENGVWEIFVPGVSHGDKYKYELLNREGHLLPLKTDPFANYHEPAPGNAAVVFDSAYRWSDASWMDQRQNSSPLDKPISIYEVHLGSWRGRGESGQDYSTYRELADELVNYVQEMGFTHIELLPVTEHPFGGSWGYQPIGLFAPTHRYGDPDDFRYFVDCCHQKGISVIVDWVPAHFPRDDHGLATFDGTALYEHEDPRKGAHPDWGTLIFNFGRHEVVSYLISSALYWIREFHVDAIRVDAVSSMLYLDYSRAPGEWIPNEHGGNENLEAIEFLRTFNQEVQSHGGVTYAEESTAWGGVSNSVEEGGLGFTFKWNMGWMHDTLRYMQHDPIHRKFHHNLMTFAHVYAYTEKFVLSLSHDEVVHGKGSLLGRMPGDDWQQFANLRAYLANMYAFPGKKLLFMGSELAQRSEWNHDSILDWHLLEHASHAGVQKLIRDLNKLYQETATLFELDFDPSGFSWIDCHDQDNSTLSWIRKDRQSNHVLCLSNFTPVARPDFCLGVPQNTIYTEILNTDDVKYGGSGVVNDKLTAMTQGYHNQPFSVRLHLPPLATVFLKPISSDSGGFHEH